MLTRIGSSPGPEWMRRIGDASEDPRQFRELFSKLLKRLFIFFGILQIGSIVIATSPFIEPTAIILRNITRRPKLETCRCLRLAPQHMV
jgi:hypothetical protein